MSDDRNEVRRAHELISDLETQVRVFREVLRAIAEKVAPELLSMLDDEEDNDG